MILSFLYTDWEPPRWIIVNKGKRNFCRQSFQLSSHTDDITAEGVLFYACKGCMCVWYAWNCSSWVILWRIFEDMAKKRGRDDVDVAAPFVFHLPLFIFIFWQTTRKFTFSLPSPVYFSVSLSPPILPLFCVGVLIVRPAQPHLGAVWKYTVISAIRLKNK